MTDRRYGRHLLATAAAFVVLTVGVVFPGWVAVGDSALNSAFGPYRVEPLLTSFLWITALGSSPTIFMVCLVATALLAVGRLPYLVLPLWVAFVGAQAVSWSAKLLVGRVRPTFLDVATASSPSFPSGHSMSATVVYGFLAFVVFRHAPPGRATFWMALGFVALIPLVGFSRMFLSLHFASDVAGGFLVGGFWLLVAMAMAERRESGWAAKP